MSNSDDCVDAGRACCARRCETHARPITQHNAPRANLHARAHAMASVQFFRAREETFLQTAVFWMRAVELESAVIGLR